jgi:hypothetical protein
VSGMSRTAGRTLGPGSRIKDQETIPIRSSTKECHPARAAFTPLLDDPSFARHCTSNVALKSVPTPCAP